ncbi:MAG: hypothetical protein SPJ13_02425 [Bacteroidales bacterium]|nr:hypothetical protein [Bacteroidales bacterium]
MFVVLPAAFVDSTVAAPRQHRGSTHLLPRCLVCRETALARPMRTVW